MKSTLYLAGSTLPILNIDSVWYDGDFEFTGYMGAGLDNLKKAGEREEPFKLRWHLHGLEVDRWLTCEVRSKIA